MSVQQEEQGLKDEVALVTTGCNGFFGQGPLMVVLPDNIFYIWLTVEDVPQLEEEHFLKGRPVKKLMFTPPEEEAPFPMLSDIPFFKKQVLVALKNKVIIDPERIRDYIARDGYIALEKVLFSMKPEEVVKETERSGLRGRGGAGFPTGRKWRLTRQQERIPKYLIANCDEGDPDTMPDSPIDHESLTAAGSMMGSSGMIVMDEDTCVVDVAKFFIQFTNDESCGKCVSCREGSDALLEVLTRISSGSGREGDIEFLEELGQTVKDASMCGLGQTLPNPVLSTLTYFRDEYEAHIKEKRCPALVCKNPIRYYIDPDRYVGCLKCLKTCPVEAITGELKYIHIIDQDKCTKCGQCLEVCPLKIGAVKKVTGNDSEELEQLSEIVHCDERRKK